QAGPVCLPAKYMSREPQGSPTPAYPIFRERDASEEPSRFLFPFPPVYLYTRTQAHTHTHTHILTAIHRAPCQWKTMKNRKTFSFVKSAYILSQLCTHPLKREVYKCTHTRVCEQASAAL